MRVFLICKKQDFQLCLAKVAKQPQYPTSPIDSYSLKMSMLNALPFFTAYTLAYAFKIHLFVPWKKNKIMS